MHELSRYGLHIGSVLIGSVLTTLHFWLAVALVFSISSTFALSMVFSGTLNLILKTLNLPAIGGNCPDAKSVTFGAVSLCWIVKINYIGCYLDVKSVQLILLHYVAGFMAMTFFKYL